MPVINKVYRSRSATWDFWHASLFSEVWHSLYESLTLKFFTHYLRLSVSVTWMFSTYWKFFVSVMLLFSTLRVLQEKWKWNWAISHICQIWLSATFGSSYWSLLKSHRFESITVFGFLITGKHYDNPEQHLRRGVPELESVILLCKDII